MVRMELTDVRTPHTFGQTGNRFIEDVMQGKMRERCSATILQQLIKQTQSRLVVRIIQARFTRFE